MPRVHPGGHLWECHDTSPLNSGPAVSCSAPPDLVNWTYVPGTTYTLELTVAESGRGCSAWAWWPWTERRQRRHAQHHGPQQYAYPQRVGQWEQPAQRGPRTERRDRCRQQDLHLFVDGPATDIGPVTFYYAGNAADGDGDNTGDHIYSGSEVASAGSVGLAEAASAGLVGVFPIRRMTG